MTIILFQEQFKSCGISNLNYSRTTRRPVFRHRKSYIDCEVLPGNWKIQDQLEIESEGDRKTTRNSAQIHQQCTQCASTWTSKLHARSSEFDAICESPRFNCHGHCRRVCSQKPMEIFHDIISQSSSPNES